MIDNAMRPLGLAGAPAPGPALTPPEGAPPPTPAAHPFAEILRQNRLAAAPPAAVAPPQKADDSAASADTSASNEAVAPESAAPQRDATQAKARLADPARAAPCASAQAPAPAPSAKAPAADTRAKESAGKNASMATPDASLIAGALASARPDVAPGIEGQAGDGGQATRGKAATASNAFGARATANDGQAASALQFDASSAQDAAPGAAADRRAALADANTSPGSDAGAEQTVEASASASFAGTLAESKASHTASASSLVERTNNDAAAPSAQAAGFIGNVTPGAGSAVAAPTLPTPLHSPDFATAFGMQVSVLAKDGVQQAELHLNPAEMGPVSIQITLDGTQARVDFGADMAATRHAIEAGLPELASALRDAGFTLAGGGVAQHSASNGGDHGGADSNRGPASSASPKPSAGPDATAQRLTRRVAAGGVDIYA
jgi:flagellar hook-length control protein FliK